MWEAFSKSFWHKGRFSWGGFLLGMAVVMVFSPWARRQLKKAAVATTIGALNFGDEVNKWSQQAKNGWGKLVQEARDRGKSTHSQAETGSDSSSTMYWKPDENPYPEPEFKPAEE